MRGDDEARSPCEADWRLTGEDYETDPSVPYWRVALERQIEAQHDVENRESEIRMPEVSWRESAKRDLIAWRKRTVRNIMFCVRVFAALGGLGALWLTMFWLGLKTGNGPIGDFIRWMVGGS